MICFHWQGAISDNGVAAGRGGGQDRVKEKPDKGLEKVHFTTFIYYGKMVLWGTVLKYSVERQEQQNDSTKTVGGLEKNSKENNGVFLSRTVASARFLTYAFMDVIQKSFRRVRP